MRSVEENVRVAMIKSSLLVDLLVDLLEVPSKKRGKTLFASFYAALCLQLLDSYLFDASSFILFSSQSIPLSHIARNPARLREFWH